jgi:hypothetical protein|tara:strand:+ start:389 stop:727 length:339 start_codon:yes stop_codon:yes gene_type:complete
MSDSIILQTVDNNLKLSKLWNISKNDLIKFDYFNKLIKFNKNNDILNLNSITDKEFEYLYNYLYNNKFNNYVEDLEDNELFEFIKLSNYLLIDDLSKILRKEFLIRLSNTIN